MKKLYLLLITVLLSITLCFTEVSATNGNEIIPFHPDPSLVTEWDVSVLGSEIDSIEFDTPILKVILPEGSEDVSLMIDTVLNPLFNSILWIYPSDNVYKELEITYIDSEMTVIWLGGGQSEEPTLYIKDFMISDGDRYLEYIYIYPDVSIYLPNLNVTRSNANLYSYNFEYELSQEYQLGYNDGWGEKNKMTDITFLIIGLIIFIIANILGFIYKNNLLTALSGLLWLLPIFLVDNIFIKIFSVIIMLITFLFSFKERGDYYV